MAEKPIDKIMDRVAKAQIEPKQMGYPSVIFVPECKTYFRLRRGNHLDPAYVLELVRGYSESHLGCQVKDVARGLGLNQHQVQRALLALRKEWRKV